MFPNPNLYKREPPPKCDGKGCDKPGILIRGRLHFCPACSENYKGLCHCGDAACHKKNNAWRCDRCEAIEAKMYNGGESKVGKKPPRLTSDESLAETQDAYVRSS